MAPPLPVLVGLGTVKVALIQDTEVINIVDQLSQIYSSENKTDFVVIFHNNAHVSSTRP